MGKGTRTALIIITALIVLICIYCLSFTFKVNSIEKNAVALAEKAIPMQNLEKRYPGNQLAQFQYKDSIDQSRINYKNRYLDSISNEKVLLWNTYKACKEQQLSLGLDLQGGMSVVLQVSLKELLQSLSDNNRDPKFNQALDIAEKNMSSSSDDYLTLFFKAFKELKPNDKLATVFATRNSSDDKINFQSSDADMEKYIRKQAEEAIVTTHNIIRSRIDQFGTKEPIIRLDPSKGRITVEIAGADNPTRVRNLLQATANLEFWETYKATEIAKSINDANTALKNYLDTQKDLGKDSSTIAKAKNLLTGESDSTAKNNINPLSGKKEEKKDTSQAKKFEEFKNENPLFAVLQPAVDENNQFQPSPVIGYVSTLDTAKFTEYLSNPDVRDVFPKDIAFLYSSKAFGDKQKFYTVYAIKKNTNDGRAPLDGSVVTQARQDYDQNGQIVVSMQMNTLGGRTWRDMTRKNIGNSIAIVLDNKVCSAPNVNSEIDGGNSQISGGFDVQEATDLANVLKTGKLPASARIIEEVLVGPSLGQQAIKDGISSLVVSFLLIVLFMLFFYSSAGLVANLVLLLNLFLIIGFMAAGAFTLTLPGLAGLVLTLGIAVDANVIIYERVKEELRAGKGLLISAKEGFKHSLSAILDGNITTLLTGFILAWIGVGPVKGFAITLIIGIFCTLFTALLLSRIIIERRLENGKELSFQTPWTKNFLQGINFDFIGKRKITYTISTIIIIIGLVSFFTRGFEMGIDFKGGREYKVRFEQPVNTADVSEELTKTLGEGTIVKQFGAANQVKITTSHLIDKKGIEVDGKVEEAVYKGLNKFLPNTSFETFKSVNKMSSSKVDPTISVDFRNSSILATLLSLVVIFLYIFIRFRKYGYSIGAIAATAHDAFIVLALFSILHGVVPFAMEVDATFIAALLTVIGYSLNDTVIIFDRLREYLRDRPNADMKDTMNAAVNSTLSRTFNTAFTVFIVVFILFLFGGSTLKAFSFAMLIGVVVGCYSSLFIASPIMYDLDKNHDGYKTGSSKATPVKKK
ncbi:MAG: protein translocase subunit SecDF [Chitinophagales bacterium]